MRKKSTAMTAPRFYSLFGLDKQQQEQYKINTVNRQIRLLSVQSIRFSFCTQ